MSIIAEKVFEAVKALPEQQAAEVLDFAEFLQAKIGQSSIEHQDRALTTLETATGIYDNTHFNQEPQLRFQELKIFFTQYQKDLTGFKFDRDEANAR